MLEMKFVADQEAGVIKARIISEYVDLTSGYLKTRLIHTAKDGSIKTLTVDTCNVFDRKYLAELQLLRLNSANTLLDKEITKFQAKTDSIRMKVVGEPFLTPSEIKKLKGLET